MARYPTLEEYEKNGRYQDGIKRCDDLLKKHPKDVQLLTTKLQLLVASRQDGKSVLDRLLAIEPPISDLGEVYTINRATTQSQQNTWPRPRSVGPDVAKLWDNAVKTSTSVNHKLELLLQRFESSVEADYMVDAQQALIQLKSLQPKNRPIYMAHAAVTQLISTSQEDMQSRLALMLAKKAVTEKFDEEKDLDCRVPGQIFAKQRSSKDLESIQGRRFAGSKQVYEALQSGKEAATNGAASTPGPKDPSDVPSKEWLAADIASLKARFAQLIEASAGLEAMLSIAANAMRLFHTSLQSVPTVRSRTKGDACFVAIAALIKSHDLSQQPRHLLISVHLAETLLKLDEHIHEARLILVYLYMRLGLGSLAIHYFDSLSIKEIQLDTVGHALFTNLSYTYPHQLPSGKKDERNPISRMKNAVQVYKRCEQRLAENEASVLSNGQTGMIFDLHELRDSLRASVTKRIILLEIRRQARLLLGDCNWHTHDLGAKCVENWIETTDNRDFAATFDYGYNVEKALHGYHDSLPGREWILYGLAADVAWCLASSKDADSPVDDPQALLKALEGDLPDVSQLTLEGDRQRVRGMSYADHGAGDLACRVLKLVLLVKAQSDVAEVTAAIESVEKALERLNIAALCQSDDHAAERLRLHYASFDILKIVAKACEYGLNEGRKEHANALNELQQKATGNIADLRSHAQEQQKRINAKAIRAEMAEGNEGVFTALEAFGREELQGFCEAIESCAKDGWSGVGKLKL